MAPIEHHLKQQYQPVPDEQDAALSEPDAAVILADDASALRHEQDLARRAIIDVLRDLRGDLAGKIGTDAGDERGGDHGSGLKHILRCGRCYAIGRDGALVGRLIEESELTILRRGRGWLRREAEAGKIGLRHGRRGRGRGGVPRPRFCGSEQPRGPRRFQFLCPALLLRAGT